MEGKIISGYTLKRLLGVGGMAEVWYAENKIGKKAAVKMLLPNLCADENVKSRFYTEAEVMVKLDHPNIRQVLDYGDIDGRPAIVMEYLEGEDLKARMKRGQRFTDEELKRWWNQLVSALNYTHQKGIVHRDIKPGNIFVDRDGNVKLLDFGIAKVRDSISKTQTGQKLGTLMYMSPEQVLDSKHVDYRTDIYSLAVTFVHLITGKRPYDSDTSSDFEISEQIVRKPLDLRGLPVGWSEFLSPYLNKEANSRPALRPISSEDADNNVRNDDDETSCPQNTSPESNETKIKERHGFVTFWLVFMVIANIISAIMNLIIGIDASSNEFAVTSYISSVLAVSNIVAVSLLFSWKKKGFWLFVLNAIISMVITAYSLNIVTAFLVSAFGVAVLYAVLQIKKNGLSCWKQLD